MKTEILTHRGTQVLELEVALPNWAGELFREYQAEKMASLPTNTVICTKRGTVGIKASEYPKSERKLPSRLRISTARGTAIRSL
ncbi:MAG: hypothetical protein IH780_01410 [Thaumarchaeota archaeon]|nr:hypothetical protein [Nitrososphaerota archaeon]